MKIKIFYVTFFLVITKATFSQTSEVIEPEWVGNIVYIVDTLDSRLPLEFQKASLKTNGNASLYVTGVGKVTSKNCVNEASSYVKINKEENLQFIVKYSSNDKDPRTIINIFKLESGSKERCIDLASAGTFSGSTAMDINYVNFTAEKYGKSSYLITIPKISQGQYAITLESSRTDFNLFSVKILSKEEIVKEYCKVGTEIFFVLNDEWLKGTVTKVQIDGVQLKYINPKNGKEIIRYFFYSELSIEKPLK